LGATGNVNVKNGLKRGKKNLSGESELRKKEEKGPTTRKKGNCRSG